MSVVISFFNGCRMEGLPSAAAGDYAWYFAYGSNLSTERIGRRVGLVPSARTASLKNHRLAFNLRLDEALYANIVPCDQSVVWGAAYWCSREMMDALDRYEGVALGWYRRSWVEVEAENGKRLRAETYIGGKGFVAAEGLPADAYLRLILTGATQHGLPEEYIRLLPPAAQVPD